MRYMHSYCTDLFVGPAQIEMPETTENEKEYMKDFLAELKRHDLPKLFTGKVTVTNVYSEKLAARFEEFWTNLKIKYKYVCFLLDRPVQI